MYTKMEPIYIYYIYIESNLLPEGTESLRIEPMRESRMAESQTNSLKFNSLYKESNRNRQNRIGTTLEYPKCVFIS
jgi:hypothetical protein